MKASIREKLNAALEKDGQLPGPPAAPLALQEVTEAAIQPPSELDLMPTRASQPERVRAVLTKWIESRERPSIILRRKPQTIDELAAHLIVRNAVKAKAGTMAAARCVYDLRIAIDGPDRAKDDDSTRGTVTLIEKYNRDKPSKGTTEVQKTVTYKGAPNRV